MNEALTVAIAPKSNRPTRIATPGHYSHKGYGTDREILHLCAESYPPPYALLDHVFNRILVDDGFRVTWVMPSPDVNTVERTSWGQSPVWLIPKIQPRGIVSLFSDYVKHVAFVQQAVKHATGEMRRCDLVQVRDDPVMAHVASQVARHKNAPYIYQLSHLKEEELLLLARSGLKGSRVKNFMKGFVGRMVRNRALRRADAVMPISRRMSDWLEDAGVCPERLFVLPEGVDASAFAKPDPKALHNLKCRYKLHGKRVICYVGTMDRIRELDVLIRAVEIVTRSWPDAHLLMVGDGASGDLQFLRQHAEDRDMTHHITFTGRVPITEVPTYLHLSDVGVSPIPNNRIYENSSPIKILEYMAAGLPVIASNIPPQQEILDQIGCGLCVPHTVQSYVAAIEQLIAASPDDRSSMGREGRQYVGQHRDFALLASHVRKVYTSLLPVIDSGPALSSSTFSRT